MAVAELHASDIAERLSLGTSYTAWLESLEALGPPVDGVPLPDAQTAVDLLDQLGLERVDGDAIVAGLPSPDATPEMWWMLERAYHAVLRDVGDLEAMRPMPSLPPSSETARCFWIYVYLAAVEDIRRWHGSHGIADAISRETLVDLGRHVRLNRLRSGFTGLATQGWMSLHFRGGLFALGRLQFAPYRLRTNMHGPLFWYDDDAAAPLASGFRRGDPALGLHIPESGPMTPAACTESFVAAQRFFRQHFPEFDDAVVTCTSWLLDDQLLEYLPANSNISQFLRRFALVPGWRDSDESVFHFVHHFPYGGKPDSIDELPTGTTLERAIVQHLRQGGHWRLRTGWLRLTEQAALINHQL
jgi:hypothetical protein